MRKQSQEFLYKLLATPSPSGSEERVQALVKDYVRGYADEVSVDLHGNLTAILNPKASRRVMLAGHADQIGFMVKHISAEGFIYVGAVGGIDAGVLPGSRVTISGAKGPVAGVIGRKPIHQQTPEERVTMKPDVEKIWIDIGAKDKKEALKFVQIGDLATFELGVKELRNGLITGPGLDDKVGLFVAIETLRLCAEAKMNHVALYAVSTVQEEIGLRGAKTAAFAIKPEVGIAIDVMHASDNPGSDNPRMVPCKLGAGPAIVQGPNCNPRVVTLLHEAAKRAKMAVQRAPNPAALGNDANAMQVAGDPMAAGSIGIPNRYMHTQAEICSLKDLENSAVLLAGFVKALTAKVDLRP